MWVNEQEGGALCTWHLLGEKILMNFGNAGAGELAPMGANETMQAKMTNPNMTELLTMRKARLEAELSEVNEALTALKANPEIERVINLVTKIRH